MYIVQVVNSYTSLDKQTELQNQIGIEHFKFKQTNINLNGDTISGLHLRNKPSSQCALQFYKQGTSSSCRTKNLHHTITLLIAD